MCKMVDFIPLCEEEGLKALGNYTCYIRESCGGVGKVEFRGRFCLPGKRLAPAEVIVRKAMETGEARETGHLNPFKVYKEVKMKVPKVSRGKHESDTDLFYFDLEV